MPKSYVTLALLAATLPAAAQTPADTLRPRPPDSLATFRLQGQRQPVRPFLTIQDQLRTVAGVQVTPYDGSPGSGQVVRIRGASGALGQSQPLYVVDGLPALNDELMPDQPLGPSAPLVPSPYAAISLADQYAEAGANPLQLLPPEAIERIEVLTGPAAVARYGALGANGVVSIHTRRGQAGRTLRVQYAAYGGVQQVRQRYGLLEASEFATVADESSLRAGRGTLVPYPAPGQLGAGTDWQVETYRPAGLQQHHLSLDGSRAHTTYLLSADYRQQSGVLRNSDLSRYGLRLALGQQVGTRLALRGTLALGETEQRLPYTTGYGGATQAALLAPPTVGVRTSTSSYSGYGQATVNAYLPLAFSNPVAVADYTYRNPQTRRLLAQLAADYHLAPHLTLQASGNFQRTLLTADSFAPLNLTSGTAPASSQQYGHQTYQTSQWAGRLAVRYERQLGARHQLGAELDYQYQAQTVTTTTQYNYTGLTDNHNPFSGYGYYSYDAEYHLHRPWARLHYALDSTLLVEASLSYSHYKHDDQTQFYPSAQVRWQPQGPAALALWLGAARTGTLFYGTGYLGPHPAPGISASLSTLISPTTQAPVPAYTDQVEAGLRVASHSGRLSGQVVAYQRTSYHALASTLIPIPNGTNFGQMLRIFDEATIHNQGLELTLAATWQAGGLQGVTALAASANRNRLQAGGDVVKFAPAYDNQPAGSFYGYQQNGLNADGTLRFQTTSGNTTYASQSVLGSGIPAQLVSLSQQLRLGCVALDAQVDGMFGYQVLNYQRAFLDTPTGYTNNATTVRDRWTPTHHDTDIPASGPYPSGPYALGSNPVSSRLLENGRSVRLSALTLTYRLRQTATQNLSVWVGGQNLLVLTPYQGYDPNVSSGGSDPTQAGQDVGAVPVPRTWLLGVRAGF